MAIGKEVMRQGGFPGASPVPLNFSSELSNNKQNRNRGHHNTNSLAGLIYEIRAIRTQLALIGEKHVIQNRMRAE